MSSFQLRRRPKNRSLAFNSSSRQLETFDSVYSATYTPPLPLADMSPLPVGVTGDWRFEELMEMEGGLSLLRLMYKNQQIHTFLS
jgi:hypothetical protein